MLPAELQYAEDDYKPKLSGSSSLLMVQHNPEYTLGWSSTCAVANGCLGADEATEHPQNHTLDTSASRREKRDKRYPRATASALIVISYVAISAGPALLRRLSLAYSPRSASPPIPRRTPPPASSTIYTPSSPSVSVRHAPPHLLRQSMEIIIPPAPRRSEGGENEELSPKSQYQHQNPINPPPQSEKKETKNSHY